MANVTDANGIALDAGVLTWSTDAQAVATVATNGVVTGVSAGHATVAASWKTGYGRVVVVVLARMAHPSREIAFLTEDTLYRPELHTIMPDGSGEQRVSAPGAFPLEFDWSPDGSKLAVTFSPYNGMGPTGLYTMAADGSSVTPLVRAPTYAPRWSPDGTRIAFSQYVSPGKLDIYVIDATGAGLIRLTVGPSMQDLPEWSPDGRRISYLSADSVGSELWVMEADGSHQQQIGLPGKAFHPTWSPDGKLIALDNGYGIWLVNADGSHPRPVTANCAPDGTCGGTVGFSAPEWSFDGQRLTYAAVDQYGAQSVVVSTASGTVLAQLGTGQCCAVTTFPQWSPDGTMIAYLGQQPTGVKWPGVGVANADLTGSQFLTGAQNAVPVGGQSPGGGRRWQP